MVPVSRRATRLPVGAPFTVLVPVEMADPFTRIELTAIVQRNGSSAGIVDIRGVWSTLENSGSTSPIKDVLNDFSF